jgi:RNA polymerase sigma-70 factor (ECF subfamily)
MYMAVKEFIRHPVSWIYTISDHIAIAVLRKKHRREAVELLAAITNDNSGQDDSREILDCLDERHRKLVYLHYWEGYKFTEISSIMNVNYSTLKSMHTKAKEILRDNLEKEKE